MVLADGDYCEYTFCDYNKTKDRYLTWATLKPIQIESGDINKTEFLRVPYAHFHQRSECPELLVKVRQLKTELVFTVLDMSV